MDRIARLTAGNTAGAIMRAFSLHPPSKGTPLAGTLYVEMKYQTVETNCLSHSRYSTSYLFLFAFILKLLRKHLLLALFSGNSHSTSGIITQKVIYTSHTDMTYYIFMLYSNIVINHRQQDKIMNVVRKTYPQKKFF